MKTGKVTLEDLEQLQFHELQRLGESMGFNITNLRSDKMERLREKIAMRISAQGKSRSNRTPHIIKSLNQREISVLDSVLDGKNIIDRHLYNGLVRSCLPSQVVDRVALVVKTMEPAKKTKKGYLDALRSIGVIFLAGGNATYVGERNCDALVNHQRRRAMWVSKVRDILLDRAGDANPDIDLLDLPDPTDVEIAKWAQDAKTMPPDRAAAFAIALEVKQERFALKHSRMSKKVSERNIRLGRADKIARMAHVGPRNTRLASSHGEITEGDDMSGPPDVTMSSGSGSNSGNRHHHQRQGKMNAAGRPRRRERADEVEMEGTGNCPIEEEKPVMTCCLPGPVDPHSAYTSSVAYQWVTAKDNHDQIRGMNSVHPGLRTMFGLDETALFDRENRSEWNSGITVRVVTIEPIPEGNGLVDCRLPQHRVVAMKSGPAWALVTLEKYEFWCMPEMGTTHLLIAVGVGMVTYVVAWFKASRLSFGTFVFVTIVLMGIANFVVWAKCQILRWFSTGSVSTHSEVMLRSRVDMRATMTAFSHSPGDWKSTETKSIVRIKSMAEHNHNEQFLINISGSRLVWRAMWAAQESMARDARLNF